MSRLQSCTWESCGYRENAPDAGTEGSVGELEGKGMHKQLDKGKGGSAGLCQQLKCVQGAEVWLE